MGEHAATRRVRQFGRLLALLATSPLLFIGGENVAASELRLGLLGDTFNFSIAPGEDLSIVLTLLNEDAMSVDLFTAEVLLKSHTSGAPSDVGGITIVSATAVEDALFDLPEPLVFPWLGGIFVQTAGLEGPSTLGVDETRSLFQINLLASPDASGTHYLFMSLFDEEDANTSGALVVQEDLIRVPYVNAASPSHPELILLATIEIAEPLAGDFDGSGVVDENDYTLWQSTFGQQLEIPGRDADGNGDGVVDLADYTIWRDNLGAGVVPDFSIDLAYVRVPEAPTWWLAALACLAGVLTGADRKSRNSRRVMGRAGRCG